MPGLASREPPGQFGQPGDNLISILANKRQKFFSICRKLSKEYLG
jgi:hypothetical protein